MVTSATSAKIAIEGASVLTGSDISVASAIDGSLAGTADGKSIKLVAIVGSSDPEVLIEGSSVVTASGCLTASATSDMTLKASASPGTNADSSVDAAVGNTTYDSSARLLIGGTAHLSAAGDTSLTASSKVVATNTADGNVGGTAGAAVGVSIITGDTTASIEGGTVSGSSVTLSATSDRTITTSANSSPGGASASSDGQNKSETTLADNKASTSEGKLKVAGAVAVGTDTGVTAAFVKGGTIDAGSGAATVSAASIDVMSIKADGEFTCGAAKGVGVGAAIGVANRSDLAYIAGATDVTAGSVALQVQAPKPSSFAVQATSGAGSASDVGVAGALGINITNFVHAAYLDGSAALTLHGSPSVDITSTTELTNSTKAAASDGAGNASKIGVGASIALTYGQDTTAAYLADNAAVTGAQGIALLADATHAMTTDAMSGAKGGTALTPVVAISIAQDDVHATLGTGETLSSGGDFSAKSFLSDTVATNAKGDTTSGKTGVGISIGVAVVNDTSLATSARNLLAAGGAVAFVSRTLSSSQTTARASVAGGEADDGSGSQSVDKQTTGQLGFADGKAKETDSSAKGTGGAKPPSASTSDGSVSVAGAVAVDVELSGARAVLGDGITITAAGLLTLAAAVNVDGGAVADGSAVLGVQGFDPTVAVDTAADTLDIGNPGSLKSGDKVSYAHGTGGTNIGGLLDGHDYYVAVQANGTLKLYDTVANAKTGGATGLVDLTSKGSGTQHALKGAGAGGTAVGVAIAVNVAEVTNQATLGATTVHAAGVRLNALQGLRTLAFDPAVSVDLTANSIAPAGSNGLRDGDAVVYRHGAGGSDIGGLHDGSVYYLALQADGSVKLYDTQAHELAGGASGLLDLTSAGTGSGHSLQDVTDSFGARATSGAGGGKTGVAGSLAINVAITDTAATLGTVDAAHQVHAPTLSLTGGDVILAAGVAVSNDVSAPPIAGGGSGSDTGVGISVGVNYGQNTDRAVVESGAIITGAHDLVLDAKTDQTMTTIARSGSKGSTAVTPVITIAITNNDTDATLGAGNALTLTGKFSAKAALHDQLQSVAEGDTESGDTGVGISVVVAVVNDNALATTSRSVQAASDFSLDATTVSSSDGVAKASVAGGEADDSSGQHDGSNDQSINNTTSKQMSFGDQKAKEGDSSAKGSGGASNDKAKTSDGSVSVAGAVAVNVSNVSAQSAIGAHTSILAGHNVSVLSAVNADAHAIATGAATTKRPSGNSRIGLRCGLGGGIPAARPVRIAFLHDRS